MTANDDRLAIGRAIHEWWVSLHSHEKRNTRGVLAQLQRSDTPVEALLLPETIALYDNICDIRAAMRKVVRESHVVAIASAASLLAVVEPIHGERLLPFAAILGRTREGQQSDDKKSDAVMSKMRFSSLIRARDWNTRHRYLRRGVLLLRGRPFDTVRFAQDLFDWNDRVRQRWIFDYFSRPHAALDKD